MRIDQYLVKNNLVQSRERAKNLIGNGGVLIDGKIVTKPSLEIAADSKIEIIGDDIAWVSRAGLKLEHALKHWKINVSGKTCADFGACTGGFTDVLLANSAKKVYAIDVGHGQLADKLKSDKRVVNMEGVHIKNLSKENFSETITFICIDTSFISLSHILPKAAETLESDGKIITLIKPQFEVGKKFIKKGIVTNPDLHTQAVEKIRVVASGLLLEEIGLIESPILGGKGNKEFLLYLKKPSLDKA